MFHKKYAILAIAPLLLGLGSCSLGPSQAKTPASQTVSAASAPVDIASLTQVLSSYVDNEGQVDYKALQKDPAALDGFNQSIQKTSPSTFESWTEKEKIAYLINAYNSLTLKSIINESPLKNSIKDIIGVWQFKKHPILQSSMTLNNIEHDILRKNFSEPRIHAALVCAAKSCPFLRSEPYKAETLDEQLDDQTRIFLARSEAFEIDREKNEVRLSSIFEWFGKDWVSGYGTEDGFAGNSEQKAVLNFITNYVNESDREFLKAGGYTIKYSKYDWSLNIQS